MLDDIDLQILRTLQKKGRTKRNELAELTAQEAVIRSKGLTPEILQEMSIRKWDGRLPSTWSGGTLPLVKTVK